MAREEGQPQFTWQLSKLRKSEPDDEFSISPETWPYGYSPIMTDIPKPSPSIAISKVLNACDDCRARKLKCSGELTGCTRCLADGIQCRYSPRKQMGRPRKRRREDTADNQDLDVWNSDQAERGETTLQNGDTNLDFIRNVQYTTPVGNTEVPSLGLDPSNLALHDPTLYSQIYGPNDHSTDLNLDVFQEIMNNPVMNSSESADQPLFQTIVREGNETQLQVSRSTLFPADYTELESQLTPCNCLPQLYTFLAAFQSPSTPLFPYSLVALKKTAQFAIEAVRCQVCSKEYATALQNSMLLGTLMNLVINEYRKLLDHIEEKSLSNEEKKMRIGEHSPGNEHLHTGTPDCPMGIDVELSGEEWRTLARKTVRKEVFGPGDFNLAKIILEMKDRQQRWHSHDGGFLPQHIAKEGAEHVKGSGSNSCMCVQGIIIDRLKQSLDAFGL